MQHQRLARAIGSTIALLALASTSHAVILRVDTNVVGGAGTGEDWPNAIPDLQSALDLAAVLPGADDIWVADGVYHPGALPTSTYSVSSDTRVFGGFTGFGEQEETLLEQRNVFLNESILSGDLNGDPCDPTTDAHHVITVPSGEGQIRIDGVIIEFGNASGGAPEPRGGALHVEQPDSLNLVNCTLRNNLGGFGGGAIYLGSPTGGGGGEGDGIVQIYNCTFENNAVLNADGIGGAIQAAFNNVLTVVNSVFYSNIANTSEVAPPGRGGAIFTVSSIDLFNCTFANNSTDPAGQGGAVFIDGPGGAGGTLLAKNCIFWGNTSSCGTLDCSADIWWAQFPSALSITSSTIIAVLPIVWCTGKENAPGNPPGGFDPTACGNIQLDPVFADGVRLTGGSPAIDSGDPDPLAIPQDPLNVDDDPPPAPPEPTPDRDLGTRILTVVDMGAFEFGNMSTACPADVDGDNEVGFTDLIAVLAAWGTCDCTIACPEDIDGDGDVGFLDLVSVLSTWGPCPGSSSDPGPTFDEMLAGAGLTPSDWEVFEDCLQNGTEAQQKNCICWLEHYLIECTPLCSQPPNCPDGDPLAKH
ncbi:MAG: hypothetical protein KJO18_10455 [Acidimicrobiia bacterium]|nr:hypothetical protein [Acidimicrobiia bacterium]NNF42301.1 hypothetical protein [Phycisphaerales bacterium]